MSEPTTDTGAPAAHTAYRPRTRFSVHLACYILLGAAFVYVLVWDYFRPLVLRDEIAVEPGLIEQVDSRLDPNTATWAELAQLPGIGESVAKRIMQYREERARSGRPVFASLRDLGAIRGIGPKTLDGLAPHLKFPPAATVPAEDPDPEAPAGK